MNFSNTYKNTDDKSKLSFLNAIIKNNEQLQREFINYALQDESASKEAPSKKDFFKVIEITEAQYKSHLESVDLENPDWDNYQPEYSGYIKEWEQYQQASEQEFAHFFDIFKSAALDKLLEQNITDFTAMLLGLYEASLNVEVEDEVGSFEDINEHLATEHKYLMKELIEKIKLSAVSAHQAENAIELFFEYCANEYPGNLSFPNYFEPLIMNLGDFSDKPENILNKMKNFGIEYAAMPQLVLLLNNKSGNAIEWLDNAEILYKNDKGVAEQLLEYYFDNDQKKFTLIADELFKKTPSVWAGHLKDFISEEIDKDLFFRIFYFLTIQQHEIEYYQKIRNYFSADTFQNLISQLSHRKEFIVEILNIEGKYGDIKQIVSDNKEDWHFNRLISPILNVYPSFCFDTIAEVLQNKISKERGRRAYQSIADTLQLAKQIKGYEKQTDKLIMQLYNNKPNLPALRDELRGAGLV